MLLKQQTGKSQGTKHIKQSSYKMVSCFEFFLSMNFGKKAKRLLWTDKPRAQLREPQPRKLNIPFPTFMSWILS